MEKHTRDISDSFISSQEWTRLVRLCATIIGNKDVAEDLAQETVLEALRHKHELRDPEKQAQWLSGIARNICLRWSHKRGRELAHLAVTEAYTEQDTYTFEETLVDDYDIEVELERKELIELLDRAMALLPSETRTVLVKRYVEESSLAEVAAQLGTNTSAVAMRIQRGKLALRKVLTNEMGQEIATYGVSAGDGWEQTPIWCYHCGQARLLGRRKPDEGELLLKCPNCSPGRDDLVSQNHLPILQGIRGYKPLFSRLILWCDNYYRTSLNNDISLCKDCGRPLSVHIGVPPFWVAAWLRETNRRTVNIKCTFCNTQSSTHLEGLVLALPEGRQFLQTHTRIRTLPRQYVEVEGRAAIITSFESITSSAHLDVVSAYDTYEVLHIYGGANEQRR